MTTQEEWLLEKRATLNQIWHEIYELKKRLDGSEERASDLASRVEKLEAYIIRFKESASDAEGAKREDVT